MDWKKRLGNEIATRHCNRCGARALEMQQLRYSVSTLDDKVEVQLVLKCAACGDTRTHTEKISRDKKLE